jgi:hypothetical protein
VLGGVVARRQLLAELPAVTAVLTAVATNLRAHAADLANQLRLTHWALTE